MRRKRFGLILGAAIALAAVLCPADATAQPRGWHRRPSVVVGVGYYHPHYYRYSYWQPYWSPWYPYWAPYWPYPYPYGPRYDEAGAVRLDVKPRNVQVYVDGYFVGVVDDFDGTFQRLRLPPGGHEISLYLEGYRIGRQNVYISPGSTLRLTHRMAPLEAGESPEPPPAPKAPPETAARERTAATQPEVFLGTLELVIQPAAAEVRIDGGEWRRVAEGERFRVELSEGTHRIEVRRAGYGRFGADVDVRRGETTALSVTLPPSRQGYSEY
jgi:hypothetical protein